MKDYRLQVLAECSTRAITLGLSDTIEAAKELEDQGLVELEESGRSQGSCFRVTITDAGRRELALGAPNIPIAR